jgi:ATP-binding cassette subfamily G (WHITE) protein 2 (SNQ2)
MLTSLVLWGSNLPNDSDNRRNPWHEDEYLQDGRERAERPGLQTPISSGSSHEGVDRSAGTWGERDAGHIDSRTAAEDLYVLREELATLSRTRSHGTQPERNDGLSKTISRKSTRLSATRRPSNSQFRASTTTAESSADAAHDEPGDVGSAAEDEDEDGFELGQFMREGHFEKRKNGESAKKVGVVYKNLTVKGVGSTASFVRTLPDAVLGTFGPDLYQLVSKWTGLRLGRHSQTRTLLNDFSGLVQAGEMLLVLGRPGSGCSTFLKAIANNRETYAAVEGDVSYGGISADKQKKQFRGEVNYNPEDDMHMANLNVWQTLSFALKNKTKKNEKEDIPVILDALLKIFGIQHTKYTPVGDEYVRGVSGGERKRVSIAETLATKSTVVCWDNS